MGTKSGRTRVVQLKQCRGEGVQSLPRTGDERVFGWKSLRRAFEAACKRADLPTSGDDRVTFQALRHTALSDLARKGTSIAVLREIGGHQSMAMLSRYLHPSHQREAVETLSDELT